MSFSTGSPPPMRGKEHRIDGTWDLLRITPAYAGKSKKLNFMIVQKKDHPRLCGEKPINRFFRFQRLGSPPPMRGKETARCTPFIFSGITPAYAGKRPRSVTTSPVSTGSPPPMRGKVSQHRKYNSNVRITPAYAGKSEKTPNREASGRDHPRLCGEKRMDEIKLKPCPGSPPPMRGKGRR